MRDAAGEPLRLDDPSPQPVQLVDLDAGRVVRTFQADAFPWPLVGAGS